MNIYQIQQELLDIFEIIEENGGEITPELEEQLAITQESFKDKIQSYTNVIKSLQTDIAAIKEEKLRLNDLQKSKEKTIERLKKIMIEAIELFGQENKSGNKFVDYGTGKVSIRTSQIVEVDDDAINTFVNRYISCLSWYNMQNQLDRSIVRQADLLEYANSPDEDQTSLSFTPDDIIKLNADIDLRVSFKDLFNSDEGFNLAKALIKYGRFNVKAAVDKNDIKRTAKETHTLPTFAKLVDNQTVTIK